MEPNPAPAPVLLAHPAAGGRQPCGLLVHLRDVVHVLGKPADLWQAGGGGAGTMCAADHSGTLLLKRRHPEACPPALPQPRQPKAGGTSSSRCAIRFA